MKLDLPDNLVNDLLNILGDMPAKRSYNLLQTIGPQADEHNRRIQAAIAEVAAQVPQNPRTPVMRDASDIGPA